MNIKHNSTLFAHWLKQTHRLNAQRSIKSAYQLRNTLHCILSLAITLSVLNTHKAVAEIENLNVSGFATWAISKSDNETAWYNNRNIKDEACFNCDTTWGIQLDYHAFDNLRASAQIVKRPEDDWQEPELEWAYLAYMPTDALEVRVGKLRLPQFLTSEFYYVGSAYPWLRPVPEVYNRQLGMTSFEGIDLIYDWYINDEYTLSVRPYWGGEKEEKVSRIKEWWYFDFKYQYGIALDFKSESLHLHLSHYEAQVDLYFYFTPPINMWSFAGFDPVTGQVNFALLNNVESLSPSTGQVTADGITYNFASSDEPYRNTAFGFTYELPLGFELWGEYQDDEQSITQYAALVWHWQDLTPYISISEAYNLSFRETSQYKKDEKYKTSETQTIGVRYDCAYNISFNLEYSYSKATEQTPHSYDANAPAGQFVESFWIETPIAPIGAPVTTNPQTQWQQKDKNTANIWSFGINWHF